MNTEAIHPLHVAEDLWGIFNPEQAYDAEDRAYRAESLAVLLETLKRDPWTIINALERHRDEAQAQAETNRRFKERWDELNRAANA